MYTLYAKWPGFFAYAQCIGHFALYAKWLWCNLTTNSAVQCSAVQCSAVQCSAVQCSAVQCSAVQCSAVQCSAVQWSAVQCSAVQCSLVQYSRVQCNAVQCSLCIAAECFLIGLLASAASQRYTGLQISRADSSRWASSHIAQQQPIVRHKIVKQPYSHKVRQPIDYQPIFQPPYITAGIWHSSPY